MAEYFAVVNDKYVQMDTRNEQLEIYETRRSANVAAWGKELKVVEVSVVNRTDYESLQRERDALSGALVKCAWLLRDAGFESSDQYQNAASALAQGATQ